MSPALADRFFTTEPSGETLWSHHFVPNRWEKVEAVTELFSWAPKPLQTVTIVTKLRHLFLGRKAMTNPESILKSTDITLLTKVHIVKAMVFPRVMYRGVNWTTKKAEHKN